VASLLYCDEYFCVLRWFFFFQAEDGIRDRNVTGVQTCALPISGFAGFRSPAFSGGVGPGGFASGGVFSTVIGGFGVLFLLVSARAVDGAAADDPDEQLHRLGRLALQPRQRDP